MTDTDAFMSGAGKSPMPSDGLREALVEAKSALSGCMAIVGNIANVPHAFALVDEQIRRLDAVEDQRLRRYGPPGPDPVAERAAEIREERAVKVSDCCLPGGRCYEAQSLQEGHRDPEPCQHKVALDEFFAQTNWVQERVRLPGGGKWLGLHRGEAARLMLVAAEERALAAELELARDRTYP